MQVIPVLDLLDGHVVRAVRGERTAYRPIRSSLASTSEPLPVARALLAASGARTLYIADLGAILETGAHVDVLAALRTALPGIEIWLDAGYADHASMRALFERIDAAGLFPTTTTTAATLVPVFGTESLRDVDALRAAARDGLAPILSLDRRCGALLEAAALEPTSSWWPARVIAMTLDQVGSDAGPDLATFERLRADAPAGTMLIGAGGIRDRADLAAAERSGANAWLVASALHDGRLGPSGSGPASATHT
ncbi:HisA/HisF-related TIM barrel protein [Paraburkholderia sp.]|uniref:HisA/HisF-related TIM barrel protein n=1 Tax=Paraburkholderia sp. TaxID=1926495 RepID=UPI003D6F0CD3